MKKMMRFVKGKRKEAGDSDRRSESSFGSRSSLAAEAGPSHQSVSVTGSPALSLSHAPRLLQSSWSISQEDDSLIDPQSTKLHQAAAKGNTEKVLKHLKKTDVNSVDGWTRTPLHLVLRRGANPDIINYEGQSALHLAVTMVDTASASTLLRNGALVNIR